MINYSEYLTYDEFKQEILNVMFLKEIEGVSTRKREFENLSTNQKIFNSLTYKTAKNLIDNNSDLFKCDLENVYKGLEDIQKYKINFLNAIYEDIDKNSNSKINTFLNELREIFMDIIFEYGKTNVLKMYTIDCIAGIKGNTIQNSNSSKSSTKFFWDVKGYAFSKLQINLAVNKDVGVNFLKNKCNFTESEIKRLTDVSSIKKRYDNGSLKKKEIEKMVSDLSDKLSNYTKELNELELSEISKRIKIISHYEYIKKIIFESTTTFLHLIDYDNQYRFSNVAKNEHYLYWHIKKKVVDKTPLLTSEFIKNFKLKYTEFGKNNPSDVKRRFSNIESVAKDNGLRNLNIEDINKYVSAQMVLDAITKNELGITSDTVYINDIETKYRLITNEITRIEIPYNKPELVDELKENKEEIKEDILKNKINSILNIPSEINEKTPINKYQTSSMLIILKELLNKFINKHINKQEAEYAKEYNNSLIKLCNSTLDLRQELNKNANQLKKLYTTIANKKTSETSYPFNSLIEYINTYTVAYEQMTKTEAAATYVLATGKIDERSEFLIENKKELNEFANSFFADKPIAKEKTKIKVTNPLVVLFKQTDFLYMKELDYRNLEATLRRTGGIHPDELGCQRIWILIYLILNIAARKNKSYNYKKEINDKDFMSNVSTLLKNIKDKKWKHDCSDIEKHFSMLYPFVKYQHNPFTTFIKDKGFNESQSEAMELRALLENKREELIDSIKECVYGENKLYDIMQGIADIAYELSTPISLYTDFSVMDMGENIINEFLNACVSSLEMQTAMMIYEFIFNFSIDINGKKYTLNSLNNMLKMFNLIVQVSKNNNISNSLTKYDKLAEYTSDYQLYKKIGFYTYNRDWDNNYDISSDLLDKLTGYYLSDYNLLYSIIEYCRHKDKVCDPGDITDLSIRVNRLQNYEWIAIYAVFLLTTKDKELSDTVIYGFMDEFNLGYLNIQKIVDMLEAEAKNTDSSITYLHPYINDLGNSILNNEKEFNDFVSTQKNFLREFFNNMYKNKRILKDNIVDKISDEKVVDWMMKMFPSYELIAQAFGFASLNGLGTLDKFLTNLMDNLNLIIKICFDRWKKQTIDTMKTRQFQLIEKERYYYIQSFPVIIDWIIKNLESYINACSINSDFTDSVDIDKFQDNLDRLEGLSKNFIKELKEEIKCMNTFQINKFKTQLLSELVAIQDFNRKDAENLIDEIFNLDSLDNVNLSKFSEEIMSNIILVFEKLINQL